MSAQGTWLRDAGMAERSAWGVGGTAQFVYTPADADDLRRFLASLRLDEPMLVSGTGSRVVVRQGGLQGVVISTAKLSRIEFTDVGVYVEAGALCARVGHVCAQHHHGALAWLAGVPGSVGGALRTNIGVGKHSVWSKVRAVKTVDRHGHAHERQVTEFGIDSTWAGATRHSDEIVLGVWMNGGREKTHTPVAMAGARTVTQLFAIDSLPHVLAAGPVLAGAVRLDKETAQLHLDATAEAADLESAIEQLCAAASQQAGRAVNCRLRFVGARG
ncbi:MAG TPA: FAD-binding protein [Denitromonas sp.]|uniref:FAD-binding protein n=1 Tax=Denitromonas sp. TaxID=2734609 RepID=UPI001E0C846C|nr:FAD-binding protein [Rhodocyclaceae bacterium]MCP5221631.1 FAD-binding protein [Zoogloeaceae bacterium]HPR07452.1 FAD-binding protein [Denitromonas sp.]HQU90251.1 FAD-binding protein [Denitromonas sp.]HQV14710.1 FAD-binding protein [Denitromonas sp.]